jgi:hypothetical protein
VIFIVFTFAIAISEEHVTSGMFLSAQTPSVGDLELLGNLEREVGGGNRGLVVVKNTLIVPTQTSDGLIAINVANPASPYEVGSAPSAGSTNDVFIRGNLAYLTGSFGLRILELSVDDLDNPTSFSGTFVGEVNLGGPSEVVVVQDDYAYTHHSFTFFIIDVSDPTNPELAGSLYLGYGYIFGLDVENNIAVIQHDEGLGIGGNGRICVVDITDPSTPSLLATEVIAGCGLRGDVDIEGELVYVSGLGAGLEIWDIADPTDPIHIGSADVPCSTDVQIRRSLAFVTSFGSYTVASVDISSPSLPVILDTEDSYWPIGLTSNEEGLLFTTGIDRVNIYSVVLPPIIIDIDIKANGSDGPITISQSDNLVIEASLNVEFISSDADWWLLAYSPMGVFHYDKATGNWVPGLSVTYQGPLRDLNPLEVLNISGLPVGSYTFCFGVDLNMNGSINMSQAHYDLVKVTINP